MDKSELTKEIENLRSLGREGGYWDFKREWYKDRADLLLDIICMANNLVNRDCFLIIGIVDGTMEVVGVEDDKSHRLSLNRLSHLLTGKKMFADHIPEIDLQTIEMEGHEVDVIVIKNTIYTPYYLNKDYQDNKFAPSDNGSKKGKKIVAGNVYVRKDDCNVGIDCQPPFSYVEQLWKKRFGMNLSIMEKFGLYLNDIEKWNCDWGNKNYAYHKEFPDFRLERDDQRQDGWCPQAVFYLDPSTYTFKLNLVHNNAVIYETELWCFDGFRKFLPQAKVGSVPSISCFWYSYYDLSTIEGKLLTLFTRGKNDISSRFPSNFNQFLIFENAEERKSFDKYLECHFFDYSDDQIMEAYRFQIKEELREHGPSKHSAFQVGKAAKIYETWKLQSGN